MNGKKLLVTQGTKTARSRAVLFVVNIVSEIQIYLKLAFASALTIVCLVGGSTAASATTLWVNDDDPNGGIYLPPGTSCNNPGYSTIQAAVNAAAPGARINVCPGTYQEQVTIPAGKNGLFIRSVHLWQAVIKAPLLMLPDGPLATFTIVRVTGAQDVTLLGFKITGPGPGPCASLHFGVKVNGGGSADLLGNHITQIRDNPFSGCQNGVAVQVGRQAEAPTNVGSARVIGNVIDNYQKNGATIDGTGSHAEFAFNRVLGIGPTVIIAQNGVQVSRGATANVRHNFISKNVYSPQTVTSTGVLLFQSGVVHIDHNTITGNDTGVDMFTPASGSVTAHNRVRASTFDGIALFPASGSQVAFNWTEQNNGPGIGVYDSQNNSLRRNYVERNKDSGILIDNSNSNSVSDNGVSNNGTESGDTTDGIRINAPSMGNTIQKNHLRTNVTHDCHDGSSGNSWFNNRGDTSSPPGLCRRDDDDDHHHGDDDDADFQTSTTSGWDASYPWNADFDIPADYDWAAAYATVDTESLLQLLPAIGLGSLRGRNTSPAL